MEQGLAVPTYQKLLDIASKDSIKFKNEFLESTRYLAGYYNNIAKDRDKTLEFVKRYLSVDSTNDVFKGIQKDLEKKPPTNKNPKNNSQGKPTGKLNEELKLTSVAGNALSKR